MEYQAIRKKAVEFMLARDWKERTARRRAFQQSLFDHSIVEFDALLTLVPLLRDTFVPPLTVQEEQVLLASAVAHDVGKERDEWQDYIHDRRGFESDVNRALTEEVVPQLASVLGLSGVEEIISAVLLHMRHERTAGNVMGRVLFGMHTNPRWKTLADVVDAVDNLCSAKGLFAGLHYLEGQSFLADHVRTSYHLVQLRGVSTTLLHRAAIDAFAAHGWSPLLHYSNGTIYVASASAPMDEPTTDEFAAQLAKTVGDAIGVDVAELVVGRPSATFLHPDFFDYRQLPAYLFKACERVKRGSFMKKTVDTRGQNKGRADTVREYLSLKGSDAITLDNATLEFQSQRIDAAQPEMMVFRFFKESHEPEIVGDQVTLEAAEAYARFVKGHGKKGVTPQTVARVGYDKVFGEGAYDDLKPMSTLMPAKDMGLRVDRYWSLHGSSFGLDVAKVEHLLDHERRKRILIDTLVGIAGRVYDAIPAEVRPTGVTPEQIAGSFMTDLVHPSPRSDLAELVTRQLHAYAATKRNARRERDAHLCPICNGPFDGGTGAKADFFGNPEAHTNRAISHGSGGKIVICDACKYERLLQQILLGSKVASVLVLFPRMNIGHDGGEVLRQKALQIWETALTHMTEANPDPDHHVSLNVTSSLARKLADVDIFRLSPADIVRLMTYESGQERKKQHRKELEAKLKELYGVGELTVEVLNENWATEFASKEEALKALIDGQVSDDDARKARAAAFCLVPQLRVVCQTPHMVLVPLANPITMGNESETNAGIRELFITLLLGLALDCSVAVMKQGEVITFEGGEGVARVPPVPALRDLVGAEWVPLEDPHRRISARTWLRAIGAAALLAGDTAFPERSNLYAILRSMTAGHIMRLIEQQEEQRKREGRPPFSLRQRMGHLELLGTLSEVLR